jgi:peptidoglycan/LPS O-acetylase OafA/YrhL
MTERRLASLDMLRGLAALSVTIPHFFIFKDANSPIAETVSILGVEVFFVLSGYVLAPQIMLFVVERPDNRNLGIFWVRRWMRTIPPYLIALLLISAAAHQLGGADFFRYLIYVQNFAHQSNANDYFSVAWSLSVEEWFYLLFPPFLIFAVLVARRRSVLGAAISAAAFVALITLLREAFGNYADWGPDVRRIVMFRMDAIAWGFLLNLAVTRTGILRQIQIWQALVSLLAALAIAIGLTMLAAEDHNRSIEAAFPFYSAAVAATAIVLSLKLSDIFQASETLTTAGEFLGRISYSMYLFHLLVLLTLASIFDRFPLFPQLALYLTVTMAIASLMYMAIEAQVLAARPRFFTPRA